MRRLREMSLRYAALCAIAGLMIVGSSPVFSSGGGFAPWFNHAGHDHRDPAQHDFAENMRLTDWNPMSGDALHMSGAHALEVRNGHLFVAAYGDMYSVSGGLYVFDVTTDPAAPALLGHVNGLGPMGGDRSMDATVDGDFAVVGVEAAPAAYTKTGIVNPTPSGVLLIDARNKAQPLVIDWEPSAGVHSVVVRRIGGADYVFTTDVTDLPASMYRIDRDPVARLTAVGSQAIFHDASVFEDPLTGRSLLFTADGSSSTSADRDRLRIWDVTNPLQRVKIADWIVPNSTRHYAHSAVAGIIDGKRIVILSSEDGGDVPPTFWVLDVTGVDPAKTLAENTAAIKIVREWTNPAGVLGGPGLRFSLHNPRLVDGTLYFAHYHAGVIALDVSSSEKLREPVLLGYYVPHEDTGYRMPLDAAQLAAGIDAIHYPRVYDVAIHPETRHIYAAEIFTGLYTIELTR